MRGWKRVAFYLWLNAVVSACVTWLALSAWSHLHPCPRAWPTPAASPQMSAQVTATPPRFVYVVQAGDTLEELAHRFGVPVDELKRLNGLQGEGLRIGQTLLIPGTPPPDPTPSGDPHALTVTVLGGGYLDEERVRLDYPGPGALDLTGWALEDGQGHRFVFPTLRLQGGGAVQVWTKGGGVNSAVELFWGLEQAIWRSGAQLTLRNAAGEVVLTYTVP